MAENEKDQTMQSVGEEKDEKEEEEERIRIGQMAQRNMTRPAVTKMVAVWLLAFLLYGPAIIFWESFTGHSIVPDEQCFAEFYFTWYFLLSASTFEFFAPFMSVAFFNLCIYLNIHHRNKSMAACVEDSSSAAVVADTMDLRPPRGDDAAWSVFFVKTRKVSSSEPTAISAVIEETTTTLALRPRQPPRPSCHRKRLSPCGRGTVLFEARSPLQRAQPAGTRRVLGLDGGTENCQIAGHHRVYFWAFAGRRNTLFVMIIRRRLQCTSFAGPSPNPLS
ncbi:hypothetical protein CRUP_024029 [Coryphaenoides rupestris]|nr:hypothetical protein CRUP_024029 [Coryphaenoides rupestris]